MDKLQTIITERPLFHKGETEIDRPFSKNESFLSDAAIKEFQTSELKCYTVNADVLSFIAANVIIQR